MGLALILCAVRWGEGEKKGGIDVRVEREGLYSLKPSSHDMSQIREL